MSDREDLDALETAMRQLRISYEKYFAGIDRLEPIREHDQVKALLRQLKQRPKANTAWRFRLQQMQASLVTQQTYWTRICRQIEEGTYKRDRMRADRMMRERAEATAGATPAAAPAAGSAAPKPSHSEAIRKLHASFADAQRRAGVAQPVSLDALARTVSKQTAALKKQFGCQRVEFKVALKEGRPILKAQPK